MVTSEALLSPFHGREVVSDGGHLLRGRGGRPAPPVSALLLAAALAQAPPFPLDPGAFWVYREAYAERRGAIDAITEEETRFEVRRTARQLLVVQTGGADPAGTVPVELGPDFVKLGPWTGEEPLPLPLEPGRSGPGEADRPGWVVEETEQVAVPAGVFIALRCALRTWRSESVLWIAPGVGVVKESMGTPGQRPEIERVLLRASTVAGR
jgi:hypothetical protein